MAPLFASCHAAHASLLLLSPNPTAAAAAARVRVGGLRVRRPRLLRLAAGGTPPNAGIPDPTVDDDEWGREPPASPSPNSRPVVADEWGEPGVLEPEQPSGADTPTNDDEWGGDPKPTPTPAPAPEEDGVLEELKRCLADTVYGSGLGLQASAEVRGEVVELVAQLEAANPTTAPVQAPDLLDGNWILLYTAYSELLPILLAGATPFSKVEKISQEIDSRSMTIVNASTISTPFASFSFSATASFEAQSPSRIEVQFKEGSFQPPEISSSVNLPNQIAIFGQKISLESVQQLLNPLQQAFASIAGSISGQPPLKVPIPGNNRAKSWLLTTYLDKDLRISRGDGGGLFVLAKAGSSLLD
ncbi:probable plastid-lipid-associated protein 3, chloroplastic [Lolium rigidum]|uniref:probable plastid-lipid-associated protein 3, chloroplastic n=1 Tax=Lolium rigidum TaxID=89674 RepID=UPI001F5C8F23|nr:probable plastid-lipid-associated protein 3, chloroplastic [Lolium rigidum]